MIKRSEIVKIARSWLGVPYRHQGRSRTGVDCAGLLISIDREAGILTVEDELNYSRWPESFSMKEQMDRHLEKIRKEDIRPGDILLFRFEQLPQHCAIACNYKYGGLSMVHCMDRGKKMTVEHRLANVWLARLVQSYKIPGVEEDM